MASKPTPLSDALYAYALAHGVREPTIAAELRAEISKLDEDGWQVAPDQGQFMAMLADISGTERFLELGTFAGYGTLWLALALPAGGQVVTVDLSNEFTRIGEPFWDRAGVRGKIDQRFGKALQVLDDLAREGQAETFDMAFIDADKEPYPDYFEKCMKLVRPGGLILVDNVFWDARVIDPTDMKSSTVGIRTLNERLQGDERVTISTVTIGDGLTIARKRT